MLEHQIEALLAHFVDREIRADEFSRQFASLYFSVRQSIESSRVAQRLCDQIIGPLAEYSRGHRSEESLREALERKCAHKTLAVIVYDYAGERVQFLSQDMNDTFASSQASALVKYDGILSSDRSAGKVFVLSSPARNSLGQAKWASSSVPAEPMEVVAE